MAIRVASLNLCWASTREQRERQRQVLIDGEFDIMLLQEARRIDLKNVSRDAFEWCCHSVDLAGSDRALGVAIMGRAGTRLSSKHQLAASDFVDSEVDEDLGRWFHERHLAVDVAFPDGCNIRLASAHATPGTSKGPGPAHRGVGRRKPRFHTRLAEWMSGWAAPFLFGIDANTPRVDALDWERMRFHMPSDGAGPGEDLLLGPEGKALHPARDLWRAWLDCPAGARDRDAIPEEGPLARSHQTGGRWYRYDQIWATPDLVPTKMSYLFDPAISDHSLVSVDLISSRTVTRSGPELLEILPNSA